MAPLTNLIQASLTGGELPPSLFGMVDLAWYKNSLKTCRNFTIFPYGGARNRTGSRMVAELKDSTKKARLMPFSFSSTQNYVLEVGEEYIRMIANGAQLLNGGNPVTVGTTFQEADLPKLKFTQSADVMTFVHASYPPSQLNRYAATTWTFTAQTLNSGPFQNINTNTELSVWASGGEGTVDISSSAPLFYAKHVGMLFYFEQKDFGESWLPGKAKVVGDAVRSGGNYYRALTAGTTGQNIPIGTGDHWNDGGVDWQYLHNGFGVARIISITSTTKVSAQVLSRLPDAATSAGFAASINVGTNTIATDGWVNGVCTSHGLTVSSYGTALVVFVGAADVFTIEYFVVDANTVKFKTADYFYNGVSVASFKPPVSAKSSATYKWAFGAFGDPAVGDGTNGYAPGYPGTVTYYQQRLVFAGSPTYPDTIWTSKTSDYSNFGQSSPVLDDDSVVFTLASNQVNQIKGLLQLDKLLLLTGGSVWATSAGTQTDVLTPGNIGVKLQSYTGVSDLPPLGIGGAALYIQDKAQIVRDMNYQWVNDSYTGQNLTAKGSHLIDGYTIVDWCFQQAPLNVVWMVRDDGVLLGLTYLREQEVAAWHRHDTDGLYESVCSISEGGEDVLYVIVKRTINGSTKRFIERFDTRVVTDITDAFFVDCGITVTNSPASATVAGLDHLEGMEVSILADGLVHPSLTVTSGAVTLQYAAEKIQVGLPYICDLETLPLAPSSAETVRGNYKLVTVLRAVVNETRSLWAGPDATKLYEAKTRTVADGFTTPPNLVTGVVEIRLNSTWERNGTTLIRHTEPTPIGILALMPEVTIGGA